MQTGTGPSEFGGWSLVVAYRLPTAPAQAIAVFDDPSADAGTLTPVGVDTPRHYALTGLNAAAAAGSVQLGVVAFEGDRTLTGDSVTVGTKVAGDADNFFASVIDDGGAARDPMLDHEYGLDAHLLTVAGGRAAGATTVTVDVTTGADNFFLGAVALAVPL